MNASGISRLMVSITGLEGRARSLPPQYRSQACRQKRLPAADFGSIDSFPSGGTHTPAEATRLSVKLSALRNHLIERLAHPARNAAAAASGSVNGTNQTVDF